MNIENVKISDLKKILKDPKALDFVRKMNPELANMTDEDFQKVVSGVDGRLDRFTDKFGNMSGSEIIDLGIKQQQEKGNKKGTSNITLIDALESLKKIESFDKLTIQEKLNSGTTLVLANKMGNKTAFDTVIKVKENLLYFYKMTESTPDHIVLTLMQVCKMIPGLFDIVYKQHITKEDMIYEDINGSFNDVSENTWHLTDDEIIEQMKSQDILQFN